MSMHWPNPPQGVAYKCLNGTFLTPPGVVVLTTGILYTVLPFWPLDFSNFIQGGLHGQADLTSWCLLS